MPVLFLLRHRAFVFLLVISALFALSACSGDIKPEFKGSDISGTKLGHDMAMQDSSGTIRTLQDYKGKVIVSFFGFTQCPDVCPTAMAELAQVMTLMGDKADKLQVILLSVDPERDTPAIIGEYAKAFHPDFVGLTGSADQLAKTAKSFKAYYAKAPGVSPDQYSMDHSSSFYVFDPQGEARVLIRGDATAQDIAHDVNQLL
jgi:protein SCO1/2